MKKNESKKSAAKQPENTQSVETVETPDTQSPSGAAVEGPGNDDAPADGEGCEAVTVVILEHDEQHALLAARSVKKNLLGVDALVVRLEGKDGATDAQMLYRFVTEAIQSERIILMTDGMMILNPVTLGDISVVKAVNRGGVPDYNVQMPVLMHRSALEELLKKALDDDRPYIDVVNEYFHGTLPEDYRPLLLGDWKTDPWVLPVISKNPPVERIKAFAEWKKFAAIGSQSWSDGLVKFLEERFAE